MGGDCQCRTHFVCEVFEVASQWECVQIFHLHRDCSLCMTAQDSICRQPLTQVEASACVGRSDQHLHSFLHQVTTDRWSSRSTCPFDTHSKHFGCWWHFFAACLDRMWRFHPPRDRAARSINSLRCPDSTQFQQVANVIQLLAWGLMLEILEPIERTRRWFWCRCWIYVHLDRSCASQVHKRPFTGW